MAIEKIKSIKPVIKWSGSKRSQVNSILELVPIFNKYYEPFVGGGSVAYAINPNDGVGGDICDPLIQLWKEIQKNPQELAKEYLHNWNRLQDEGYLVFYEIRDRYNKYQNPNDLLFLSRTCVNGLIRFNKDGEFNNSLHHTRKGIQPERLKSILEDWSTRIKGIEFRSGDYRDTTWDIKKGDFIYLDPPYFNTKGRYFGTINYDEFLAYLEKLNSLDVKYALSFDGIRKEKNYMVDLPKELYKKHIFISSGNSSFKKVMDKKNEEVHESLYLNFDI